MENLIIEAKNGNEDAFTKLFLMLKEELYRIAKVRLNNDYDINDAIQETMINAYKNLRKLKDNKKFKQWIFKISINECNKIYKEKYKRQELVNKMTLNSFSSTTTEDFHISNSNLDLQALLETLEYKERIIITLFYGSNYNCNEIANILHMNKNTVKSKLSRAREKIKRFYEGGESNE